uniref:Uncharacterized protein n=1 Tax=viral metagenome TaxID=1070528 RepID=A0A6M3LC36_9ZZZZ
MSGDGMKLLDLFCGAIDKQKNNVYSIIYKSGGYTIWERLNVYTVGKWLMLSDHQEKSFVLIDATKGTLKNCQVKEIAESVALPSQLTGEIKTGVTALKNAAKKHIRKVRYVFIRPTQIFIMNITRRALPRTLAHGEINTAMSVLKLSNYLGGSVLYAR